MVTINVPQTSDLAAQGPTNYGIIVPVSAISTQQGGLNLYQMDLAGLDSLLIDATNCNADLLIQFFFQGSTNGAPFLWFAWANQREVFRFDSPLDFVVISNATQGFSLPSFMQDFLPYRAPQNTSGFLLIAGQDATVSVDGLSNTTHIGGSVTAVISGTPNVAVPGGVAINGTPNVAIPSGVAATQAGTWQVAQGGTWNVGPSANFPVVNPAGAQLTVSRPYVFQGSFLWTGPITLTSVGTITPPANVTGIVIQYPHGYTAGPSEFIVWGHSSSTRYWDGPLVRDEQILVPILLPGLESFDFVVTDSAAVQHGVNYGYVYDTSTIIPQNLGAAPLSVTPATGSSLTAIPGSNAGKSAGGSPPAATTANVIGSSFATPSQLFSFTASIDGTCSPVAGTINVGFEAYLVLESTVAAHQASQRIILAMFQARPSTSGSPLHAEFGSGSLGAVFPFPIPVGNFITDATSQLTWYTTGAPWTTFQGAAIEYS